MKRDYLVVFDISTNSKNKVLSIASNFLKYSTIKNPIGLNLIKKCNKEDKERLLSFILKGG